MKNYLNYYKAKLHNCSNFIELESVQSLHSYIEKFKIDLVFKETITEKESFIIHHNNLFLFHSTNGFNTVEEYVTATEKGFALASEYYEALELGYTKYTDYQLVKQAGIANIAIFETIKKKGFIEGLAGFKELLLNNTISPLSELNIENPYQLYLFAQKQHFEDCNTMLDALAKGFSDGIIYSSATHLKFPTYADYKEATEKQFGTYEDLVVARDLKIKDAKDFAKYLQLVQSKKANESFDEIICLNILSKLEQGKKISAHKLSIAIDNAVKEFAYEDTNELPLWLTRTLTNEESINTFLEKNDLVKTYGTYDSEGEYFEIHKLQERAVVLDASNIAHNSNNNADKGVFAGRIIQVVEFLKSKGFNDITIIADASLRHKVDDKDIFDKLKHNYNYVQSPVNTSADSYIISFVKMKHCLVVSNDGFRQWKLQDKWVADNMDFYKLGFLINNNEVIMPDVK